MCGIIGINYSDTAAEDAYYGLFALQHRGQESAGIATSDGQAIHMIRGQGEVSQVFEADSFIDLQGRSAIGQVRYPTTGPPRQENQQPVVIEGRFGKLALVHNGNLTNQLELREYLLKRGCNLQTTSDSELILHLMSSSEELTLEEALISSLRRLEGAYNFLIMTRDTIYAMRDPHGFRPLSLGRRDDTIIVASETVSLNLLKARHVRDVNPGEVIRLDRDGTAGTIFQMEPSSPTHLCSFELAYFSRPDSIVFGQYVYEVREKMGRLLAQQAPVEADIVVPVPDSGVNAAVGYAEKSGIRMRLGLIRNHYTGRSFIGLTQEIRTNTVRIKLNPIARILEGKRVVLIDDSIVRGTTSLEIVQMVREAGAAEVHMRISSPPTVGPCFYGIDTPRRQELIAATHTKEQIRDYIGADSLDFLSIDNYRQAIGQNGKGYCLSCHTNIYPLKEECPSRSNDRRQHP